ncbi:MAG TPA: DUF3006 domain-containing protein [Firmicutes bacterium]|jgi:hypothetical protein|nr:DUF3006 domain-containing protein [Bacillota bacterium]
MIKQKLSMLLVGFLLCLLVVQPTDTSSTGQIYIVDKIEADVALLLWAEDESLHLALPVWQLPDPHEGAVLELLFIPRPDLEQARREQAGKLLRGLLGL